MYKLYDYLDSGNGYKIRLLLNMLNIPYELIEKDIMAGETRTPDYLAMNPNGRIPLLELEDGTYLAESGAILHYLAEGSQYLPTDSLDHAQVLQWMFFEQYSHEPTVAVSRFIIKHSLSDSPRRGDELASKQQAGHAALGVMEKHLNDHHWFAARTPTIADIALFAYTHVAPEGGINLDDYQAINSWIERVKTLPGFVNLEV